ncbi:MAG TPA: transglycosylase SLT domain-containing protein [Gemmatimonadaceae bacterium]
MRRTTTLLRQLLLALGAAATVVFTAQQVRPAFFSKTSVAQRVLAVPRVTGDSGVFRLPWLHAPADLAMRTPEFERDRLAFTRDLLATGNLTPTRATRIADAAVRQAYRDRIPPALVLGVMLVENDEFKPSARSKVGAVGLMQIMPRIWRPTLGKKFGTNLKEDTVNVRYGVFILRVFHDETARALTPKEGYRKALLAYNGCVTGKNTRGCHRYPEVVKRRVVQGARNSCAGRTFDQCVVEPLWLRKRVDRLALRGAD